MQGSQRHDFGVFLPMANGGWIISDATPPLDGPVRKQNLVAAVAAEGRRASTYVMSMGQGRGFGGATNHWGALNGVADDDGRPSPQATRPGEGFLGHRLTPCCTTQPSPPR